MKNSRARSVAMAFAGAIATSSFIPAFAADTQSYLLTKGQHFVQTNSAAPVLAPAGQKPFEFFSMVEPSSSGSVTNAILRLPSLQNRVMSNFLDAFEFERSFSTRAQLDAAFPEGQYRFVIDTLSEGRKNTPLTLPAAVYPPVPRVLNFADLQEVEADQELGLSWAPFSSGNANDYVLLEIAEQQDEDNIVFSSPGLLEPGVLNGTNTSVAIPAGTLSYDTDYVGRLLFVKRTMLNTNGYPGVVGISGYFRDTEFPLATLTTPPAAGRLQFSSSAYSSSETNGVAVVTVTRSGSQGQVSVNFSTSNGTASDGQDYVGQGGVVTFNDGVVSTNIAIALMDDFAREGNETVQLSLSNPTGGAVLGSRSNALLTLLDNETAAAGTLVFSAPRYALSETGKVATLTINRVGGSSGAVRATYETRDGTATAGSDYIATNGLIGFGPGVTSKKISVRLRDDTVDEVNETVSVVLTGTTGGAALGTNSSANIVIQDNDVGGVLAFSAVTFKARENAPNALLTVTRTGGVASGVTVDYETIDDTASAGADYTASSGTLTFGANEKSKTISVPILQDFAAEGNERFFVRLSNPTGRATLGVITNANFVIVDDESSVSFGNANYVFSETNKALVIPVLRSGDLKTPVSVGFATANGTAFAGLDYIATNGVLNFPTNTPSRNIVIPIVRDHVIETDETFSISLSNPQGGVQLGSIATSSITITNDDFAGRIAFSAATYSTTEGTAASIIVKRGGGLASGVTVQFDTIAGTATAGTDYKTISTNITFAGGEASKTIKIPTVLDVSPESGETVTVRLSDPTGGATLGNITNAVLTIANKPDPNAIPAAGESFMNVTITGIQGNNVSKSMNITHNPLAQETISSGYTKSLGLIQGLTGSKTTVVISGFTAVTTFHVLQFPLLNAPGPGIYQIDPSRTDGGAIWTFNTSGGESHAYGTGRTGSSGTVTIDVLNPNTKVIAGRFDFVAVQDGGTKKVRIKGSFRVKNVAVN